MSYHGRAGTSWTPPGRNARNRSAEPTITARCGRDLVEPARGHGNGRAPYNSIRLAADNKYRGEKDVEELENRDHGTCRAGGGTGLDTAVPRKAGAHHRAV